MTTPHDPTGSFSPLDAVIAAYLQAVESGQDPDRAAILDRHPDLAGPLRDFFEDLDRVDRAAVPFRLANGPAEPPSTVRYFGDYELLEEVARGGMGVVYRARQASLNRVVALKMVLAGGHASPAAVRRFRLEAEAAANLDHPQIVPIHEVGEHAGLQYFSMKFVDGVPLARHPRGGFRDEAAGVAGVARAVHHAHRQHVPHRDLKPSNILVDPQAGWLVTDFGLAKRLADVDGSLTETGDILGTPRYMAPEQAAGRRDLTETADVYSLGAILFERLTGRPPFLADNVITLLHQVRESDPPRPSTLVPGLNRDLETIALKCLEKHPTRRYPTAEALALDLENWLAGRPIIARPVGPMGRGHRWCKRNPAVSALLATVAASLLLGTAISIAFALKADARALDAGLAATRAQILVAKGDFESSDWTKVPRALEEGILAYARAFALAPPGRPGDDLRWCILANLAVEAQRRRPLFLERTPGDPPPTTSAMSLDGRLWAEGGFDYVVRVWDITTGRLVATLPRHPRCVWQIAFSPDGGHLATIALGNAGRVLHERMDNFRYPS